MSLNKCMFIGRLGKEPEIKHTNNGKAVVNISLAVSEFRKDNAGQRQEKTEWISLVFWERTAEILSKYCSKGSRIFVEGRWQSRDWQDNSGNTQKTTEVVVNNLVLLSSRPNSQSTNSYPSKNKSFEGSQYNTEGFENSSPPEPEKHQESDVIEDDIPF